MRWTVLAAGAVVALLAALPAASAKGILEDQATYPPGVTGITRDPVQPGQDFMVRVETDQEFDQAAMVVCRFKYATDAEPNVCWSQIAAVPLVDGLRGFTADSSKGQHPQWEDGWIIGYKLILKADGAERHAPAVGGEYYKVLVAPLSEEVAPMDTDTGSRAAPFCAVCVGAIGLAAVARRRGAIE